MVSNDAEGEFLRNGKFLRLNRGKDSCKAGSESSVAGEVSRDRRVSFEDQGENNRRRIQQNCGRRQPRKPSY